ncbi:hypothetical protein Bca101_058925 [Brassica carinata]
MSCAFGSKRLDSELEFIFSVTESLYPCNRTVCFQIGKLGKKARKFAKKNLQTVEKKNMKQKIFLKRKFAKIEKVRILFRVNVRGVGMEENDVGSEPGAEAFGDHQVACG